MNIRRRYNDIKNIKTDSEIQFTLNRFLKSDKKNKITFKNNDSKKDFIIQQLNLKIKHLEEEIKFFKNNILIE